MKGWANRKAKINHSKKVKLKFKAISKRNKNHRSRIEPKKKKIHEIIKIRLKDFADNEDKSKQIEHRKFLDGLARLGGIPSQIH